LASRLVSPKQAKDGSSTKAAQLKVVPACEIRYSDNNQKGNMNRIYQGKVTAVEIPALGYRLSHIGHSPKALHHELFQDAVNRLLRIGWGEGGRRSDEVNTNNAELL
jgi:hypothetical protein